MLKRDGLLGPARALYAERVGVGEPGAALDEIDIPLFAKLAESAGQLLDHALLPRADLVRVELRVAEHDAPARRFLCFVEDRRDVEKRLRRDTAAIQADAARVDVLIDQRDLHAQVGCQECRRISAGPGADHDKRLFL